MVFAIIARIETMDVSFVWLVLAVKNSFPMMGGLTALHFMLQ